MGGTPWNRPKGPMVKLHVTKQRRWGPWAWSADQPRAPTAPNFLLVGCPGLPCLVHAGLGLS